MADNDEVPELFETERARWDAVRSAVRGMAEAAADGTLDEDGVAASFAQIGQVDLDMRRVRDSLHVPEDAGEHRDALTALLLRIPDGWGRWISCDAGWYPLITRLDAQLAALDPGYVVHQVKEKFGTLRYYAQPSSADEEVAAAFEALIDGSEQQSAVTCERCGAKATACKRSNWYKTLCADCAQDLAFTPIGDRSSGDG
jgi:hypothetical protein